MKICKFAIAVFGMKKLLPFMLLLCAGCFVNPANHATPFGSIIPPLPPIRSTSLRSQPAVAPAPTVSIVRIEWDCNNTNLFGQFHTGVKSSQDLLNWNLLCEWVATSNHNIYLASNQQSYQFYRAFNK